jgi:hypothetical protein
MRRVIAGLLAIFLLVATGCSDKKSVPSGILPREKMENVLWDMIQADQYTADLAKDSSAHIADLKTERLRLYDQVFRLHDVSRDKFRKSYQYYTDHPELSQELFDSLLVRGNQLRSEQYAHPITKPLTGTPASGLRDTLHKPPPHFPLGSPFNHSGATPNHPGAPPNHPATTPPGKRPPSIPAANRKAV